MRATHRFFATGAALVLSLAQEAHALDPAKPLAQCTLDVWRARDGLPGPWVRAIAQTPDGYLWVAAFGGLARYDGARFVPIGSARAFPTAIDIADLTVAPDGRLWILPANGDPLCARGEELERCLPSGVQLPPGARLTALLPESDGSAWIATRDELYRYTGGRLALLGSMAGRPNVAPPELPFGRVGAFARDPLGLWLATDRGLFRWAAGSFTLEVPGAVSVLAASTSGDLWIAAPAGLARRTATAHPFADGYRHGRLNRMIEDRHGNVWIASSDGLIRFRDGHFETFTEADGLPDNHVSAVFEDREGSLWVGTRGGGLAQFTDRTLQTTGGPPSLRDEQVTSVAEDDRGVWLGSRRGLLRWQDGRERLFTTADGLPADRVNSVLPGAAGEVWVGTERGLVRWASERLDPSPLVEGPVNALHRDRAGALWIGGQDVVFRWRAGRLERFGLDAGLKGQVRALGGDDRGEMWVAAIGGVGQLRGDRFEKIQTLDGARVATARAIATDRGGVLWFATNVGLISLSGGRFRVLPRVDPVLVGQVYQVLSEDDGHLWVGTTRGLVRIDPAGLANAPAERRPPFSLLSFETSDRRRDATATGTHQPGAWRMRDGRLWFGSDQGVLIVDPRRPAINTMAPSVVIERALLDGHAAALDGSNTRPPGPGYLEFHFAVITLVAPRQAQHRYRLEGFDRDWIDAGPRRVAQYTNIPPGRYRFRVQGSNADGVWNEAGDTVAFTLAPRFYVTPWFRVLIAAAIVALALLLHRLRLRVLRRTYLAAFDERSRLARELHDTLLQSMSAIGMQLRGVRRRLEPAAPAAARELESVEDMVTMSLDETRRFVWNLREQAQGSGDLGVALVRLGDRLTQGRPIACHTHVEGEVRALPNGMQDQLFRIAQEAVANAVKHGDPGHIDVALWFEPGHVRLLVTDDGRGFDPALVPGAAAGHFGLVGMRERAQNLGPLTIDSRPGGGTRIEITVPTTGKEPQLGE